MENLTADMIPAWLVALNMIFAGVMLRIGYKKRLRSSAALFIAGTTLLAESLVYLIAFQLFSLDLETRGFISRLVIITVSMSLYLPLFVSYLRSKHRDT